MKGAWVPLSRDEGVDTNGLADGLVCGSTPTGIPPNPPKSHGSLMGRLRAYLIPLPPLKRGKPTGRKIRVLFFRRFAFPPLQRGQGGFHTPCRQKNHKKRRPSITKADFHRFDYVCSMSFRHCKCGRTGCVNGFGVDRQTGFGGDSIHRHFGSFRHPNTPCRRC